METEIGIEKELEEWVGRFVEVRIVDQAGEDPIAPPRVEMLHRVVLADEGALLKLYFNPQQFMSVPLFGPDATTRTARMLRSEDRGAKLVYEVKVI